ncbi:MAG: hypothetical protein ACPLKV_00070, partial [Minisyncoccia bacterium]
MVDKASNILLSSAVLTTMRSFFCWANFITLRNSRVSFVKEKYPSSFFNFFWIERIGGRKSFAPWISVWEFFGKNTSTSSPNSSNPRFSSET